MVKTVCLRKKIPFEWMICSIMILVMTVCLLISECSMESVYASQTEYRTEQGHFIESEGNCYYWQLTVENYQKMVISGDDASGGDAYYSSEVAPATLVCLQSNGEKKTVVQMDGGFGEIYLINDRLYFGVYQGESDTDYKLYSCKIDGSELKLCGRGRWKALDKETGMMLMECDDGWYVVDYETQETRLLSGLNDMIRVLLFENGIIYYEADMWKEHMETGDAPFVLKRYQINNGQSSLLFRDVNTAVLTGYDANTGMYSISGGGRPIVMNVQATDTHLYFSYGCLAGTGVFYQGGNIARVEKAGSVAQILVGKSTPGLEETGADEQFLVIETPTGPQMYYQDAWNQDIVYKLDINSGTVQTVNGNWLPSVADEEVRSAYHMGNYEYETRWYCYEDSYENAVPLLKQSDLSVLQSDSNELIMDIKDVEKTASWIYFDVAMLRPTTETNHQYYDLQKLTGYRRSLNGAVTEMLYSSEYETKDIQPITNLSGLTVDPAYLPLNLTVKNLTGGSLCEGNGFDYEELYVYSQYQGGIRGWTGIVKDTTARSVVIGGRIYEAQCVLESVYNDNMTQYEWILVSRAKDGSDKQVLSEISILQPYDEMALSVFVAGADMCASWETFKVGAASKRVSVLDYNEVIESRISEYLTFNQNWCIYRSDDSNIYITDTNRSDRKQIFSYNMRDIYLLGNLAVYMTDDSQCLEGYYPETGRYVMYTHMPVNSESVLAYNYHNAYTVTPDHNGTSILRRLNTDTNEITELAEITGCRVTKLTAAKDFLFLEVQGETDVVVNASGIVVQSKEFIYGYNLSTGEVYLLGVRQ